LLGSRHLAELAKSQNWNILAMLNNDIVGNSQSSDTFLANNLQVRIFSIGGPEGLENDGPQRQLARYIKEVGERYVDQIFPALIYRRDRYLRGGDQNPFLDLGFNAIRITEMEENFLHQHQDVRVVDGIQYGDLAEFMDFPYLTKVSRVNLASMANLALAPASPRTVVLDTARLTNFSTIRWQAPSIGPEPAGYYLLKRESSSSTWQTKLFVNGTDITVPYSKDNYIFAVQSLDAQGHESLPVVAR